MPAAISVQHLSKAYIIGHQARGSYLTLRETMTASARALRDRLHHPLHSSRQDPADNTREEFWALKNVSFDLQPGERLGIIGRNGAGKSTLLKILSRITEPSAGRVEISGRVASLLEVGTGFHPELTGRENVFLNGAVLGMSRAEILSRFDEIVAFADVEKFLDTPVKRYSSGMYVRLAFSVAAHLECDILIVDEVLSVGDAAFQKKCLGKLEGLTEAGRTVLFVSHNMEIIQRLCNTAIFLENGAVRMFDHDTRSVIGAYTTRLREGSPDALWVNSGSQLENPWFIPRKLQVTDAEGAPLAQPARNDGEMWVEITGSIEKVDSALQVGYAVFDENGTTVYTTAHTDGDEGTWGVPHKGDNVFRGRIPPRLLNEGTYRIEPLVALYWGHWVVHPGTNAPGIQFEIQGGLSDSPQWVERRPGPVAPLIEWQVL